MSDIVEVNGPYNYVREHIWRGGWSVRCNGVLVALVFDKLTAFEIAKALGNVSTYGISVGEYTA